MRHSGNLPLRTARCRVSVQYPPARCGHSNTLCRECRRPNAYHNPVNRIRADFPRHRKRGIWYIRTATHNPSAQDGHLRTDKYIQRFLALPRSLSARVVTVVTGEFLSSTQRGCPPTGHFFRKVTCRKREWICYVPTSIAFWGQKAVCWDYPKPLKVSGIFLTSLCLGDQTRCLLVFVIADTESI